MAVREHKGSWCCYWNDENGKRHEKYFGSGPVGKFKANKFNKRMGFGQSKRKNSNAVQFAQFLPDYLKHIQAKAKNEKNFKNVEWNFSGNILPFWGVYDIYGLIHSDLDDYIIRRKGQKTKKGTPPTLSSINREIDDIQSYLNWCVTTKRILNNPLKGYRRPANDKAVIDPPSVNEINKLIENAVPHIQRFIILSYYVGVRPGPIELSALKWEHINWDEQTILVRSADKKGLTSRRVSMHPALPLLLKQWSLEDRNNQIKTDHIIHFRGKPVTSIKKGFKRAKERAGITRRIRPYDIRHSHVTHQLDEGADIKAVAANIGHKSEDTTRKVYQHISGKLQKEAIEKLPKVAAPAIADTLKRRKI